MAAERWIAPFTCPACGGGVERRAGALCCVDCGETVPVVDGVARYPTTVDRPAVATCFDALAPVYETPLWFPTMYRLVGGPFAPADDRAAVARRLDAAGDRVLDVACGTGRFTRHVASAAAFAWGIDASVGMLRRATRYAARGGTENVAFARMDAGDLRFADGFFDAVACCWALHLFADPTTPVREMYRVLRPGGRLAGATLGTGRVPPAPGVRSLTRTALGAHVFDGDGLRDLLADAGFSAVERDARGVALFFSARK